MLWISSPRDEDIPNRHEGTGGSSHILAARTGWTIVFGLFEAAFNGVQNNAGRGHQREDSTHRNTVLLGKEQDMCKC